MYPKGHEQLSPDPTLLPHVLLRCGGIPAFYHTKKSPKTHPVFCSCSHAAVSFVKNSKSIPLVHTQLESCGTGGAGCHWIFLFIGMVLISKVERSLLFQSYLRSFRASVQRLREKREFVTESHKETQSVLRQNFPTSQNRGVDSHHGHTLLCGCDL